MISIVTMITVLNSPSQPVPNLKRHNKDSMGALSGRLTTAVPKDQYLIWWIKSYNGCDDNEESYDENDNDISRTDPIVCWVSKEKRKHDAKSFTCIINIINLLLIIIIVCQHYYYLATSSTLPKSLLFSSIVATTDSHFIIVMDHLHQARPVGQICQVCFVKVAVGQDDQVIKRPWTRHFRQCALEYKVW